MKYCSKCGKKLVDEAVVCTNCGCGVEKIRKYDPNWIPPKAKCARIIGILSLLICSPMGILAIVMAILSTADTGGKMCSQAKWGVAFGVTAICLFLISFYIAEHEWNAVYNNLHWGTWAQYS